MNKEQLALKYGNEEVLVVNKSDFNYIKDGLSPFDQELLDKLKSEAFFVLRKDAEYNPEYIQLIPYVLIKNEERYFAVKRTAGDERLVGKISIGMGGHINPIDKVGETDVLVNNIKRELSDEELHIDLSLTNSIEPVGFLRYTDPNDIVSQDHMGIFYLLDTRDSNVSIKETDKMVGGLWTKEEIVSSGKNSESWSRIIIEEFLS